MLEYNMEVKLIEAMNDENEAAKGGQAETNLTISGKGEVRIVLGENDPVDGAFV